MFSVRSVICAFWSDFCGKKERFRYRNSIFDYMADLPLIYIVEDESSIAEALQLNLELEGYECRLFDTGVQAMERLSELAVANLVILDNMLPGFSGVDICTSLREISEVPILFLSAKGTGSDRIEGLRSGADDYMTKPFELEELLLRIKILLSRNATSVTEVVKGGMEINGFQVDFKTYNVSNRGKVVASLSKKEIALLQFFQNRVGEVISREEILEEVWGADVSPTARTIDNFILSFRKLFESNPKEPVHFHSIRGVGYRFTL